MWFTSCIFLFVFQVFIVKVIRRIKLKILKSCFNLRPFIFHLEYSRNFVESSANILTYVRAAWWFWLHTVMLLVERTKLISWKFILRPASFQFIGELVEGRDDWQDPQGLGVTWIFQNRKWQWQTVADVATTLATLPSKNWPWRPYSI